MSISNIIKISIGFLAVILIAGFLFTKNAHAADFNPNNLISDGEFINVNSWSTADIQAFLNSMGGMLKDYRDYSTAGGGRTAAEIIYDAAHGHGEASGPPPDGCWGGICINTTTGTINPKAILATLQKEQSLITRTDTNQYALDWAMGYGCPDDGTHEELYKGFTNQIEWASWQFRYNYERASGLGLTGYQVGDIIHFYNTYPNPYGGPPEQDVRLDNRATASLYRYTPHVYNGNYNFWRLYNMWFNTPQYAYQIVSQSSYVSIYPGESSQFQLVIKNLGSATWDKNTFKLGTSNPGDRISQFLREGGSPLGWISANRIQMSEDTVASGENATFTFYMKAPETMLPGDYKEYFRPVIDGTAWLEDKGIYWNINIKSTANFYTYDIVSQNSHPTLYPGQSYNFTLTLKNTGSVTWYKDIVRLGSSNPLDRVTSFLRSGSTPTGWLNTNRIQMTQTSVATGADATFSFWMTVPSNMTPGTYREYFRPVADGISWLTDRGIYWDIIVGQYKDAYQYDIVSQNAYPSPLMPGDTYNFNIVLKNTGNATWQKDKVNLGTSNSLDRVSLFLREGGVPSGWISKNRITFQEESVVPGQNATFNFWMKVPLGMKYETYREYFRPVLDGFFWLTDRGIYWDITTSKPHSAWAGQSAYPTMHAGETKTVYINFRNTGTTTWRKDGTYPIRLGTSNPLDRSSRFISGNRVVLKTDSVAPGDVGTFEFHITAPADITPGTYREYFRPVSDGYMWLEDQGVYLDIIIN